jgi:hypothetical protein
MPKSIDPNAFLWHGAIQAARDLPWWGDVLIIVGLIAEAAQFGKKRRRTAKAR